MSEWHVERMERGMGRASYRVCDEDGNWLPQTEEQALLMASAPDMLACLGAFVIAFSEDSAGNYHALRAYAESKGIYADDLGRDRILLRIAQAALGI